MPGFDSMSDEDMAALLTYLTGLDHAPVTYSADEIKAARAARLSPSDMAAVRAGLVAKKIVP